MPGARRLDVGGLLARLPAACYDERARDGRALRSVDVVCVAEAQAGEIVAGEPPSLACQIELDQHLSPTPDLDHLAAFAVLDPP
jgi:hypothetical protein